MVTSNSKKVHLLFLLLATTSLEILDLGCNTSLALLESEFVDFIFERFGFPVLRFFCGLELGILTDCGIGISINFLNIFRTNTLSKI